MSSRALWKVAKEHQELIETAADWCFSDASGGDGCDSVESFLQDYNHVWQVEVILGGSRTTEDEKGAGLRSYGWFEGVADALDMPLPTLMEFLQEEEENG